MALRRRFQFDRSLTPTVFPQHPPPARPLVSRDPPRLALGRRPQARRRARRPRPRRAPEQPPVECGRGQRGREARQDLQARQDVQGCVVALSLFERFVFLEGNADVLLRGLDTVITPNTPLEELEAFFTAQSGPSGSGAAFALVTDGGAFPPLCLHLPAPRRLPYMSVTDYGSPSAARKFVLGIVTVDDLTKCVSRLALVRRPATSARLALGVSAKRRTLLTL